MLKNKTGFVSIILLLVLGALLFWLSFRSIRIHELVAFLDTGNYLVAIPVLLISLAGYWFRAKRWQLMLNAVEQPVPANQLFASICTGYLVNYAIPRFGEITRCLLIKRSASASLDKLIITVIAERTVDTLCLLSLLASAWLIFADVASAFFYQNVWMPVSVKLSDSASLLLFCLSVLLLFAVIIWLVKNYLNKKIANKLEHWKITFLSVLKIKKKKAFFLYTSLIWLCYFLMTYLWFFIFKESSHLDLGDAFLVMVVGSIGRSIPIQGGGIGAYHFLVSQCLLLFGIPLLTGNALALVIHGAQSLLTIISGIICYLWFLISFKQFD